MTGGITGWRTSSGCCLYPPPAPCYQACRQLNERKWLYQTRWESSQW
jgi:hypothetical protein